MAFGFRGRGSPHDLLHTSQDMSTRSTRTKTYGRKTKESVLARSDWLEEQSSHDRDKDKDKDKDKDNVQDVQHSGQRKQEPGKLPTSQVLPRPKSTRKVVATAPLLTSPVKQRPKTGVRARDPIGDRMGDRTRTLDRIPDRFHDPTSDRTDRRVDEGEASALTSVGRPRRKREKAGVQRQVGSLVDPDAVDTDTDTDTVDCAGIVEARGGVTADRQAIHGLPYQRRGTVGDTHDGTDGEDESRAPNQGMDRAMVQDRGHDQGEESCGDTQASRVLSLFRELEEDMEELSKMVSTVHLDNFPRSPTHPSPNETNDAKEARETKEAKETKETKAKKRAKETQGRDQGRRLSSSRALDLPHRSSTSPVSQQLHHLSSHLPHTPPISSPPSNSSHPLPASTSKHQDLDTRTEAPYPTSPPHSTLPTQPTSPSPSPPPPPPLPNSHKSDKDRRNSPPEPPWAVSLAGESLRTLSWLDVCGEGVQIAKIAEASYAEVYRVSNDRGVSIIKVIRLESPLKPQTKPQQRSGLVDEEPHPESDLLGELQISEWVAAIPGFVVYKERYLVEGRASKALLETHQAFHRRAKRQDPDRLQFYPSPSRYLDTTKFLVIELGDAGTALEDFAIATEDQLWDIFFLVAIALARAEDAICFEHRDLHEGNLCVRQCRPARPRVDDVASPLRFGYSGLDITILDYGLSRAEDMTLSRTDNDNDTDTDNRDYRPIACDLEQDLSLFQSTHAAQCDVYRQMRSFLVYGDRRKMPLSAHAHAYPACEADGEPISWMDYAPYTNVLWLAYLYQYLVQHFKDASSSSSSSSSSALDAFRSATHELWTYLDPEADASVPCFGSAGEIVQFAVEAGWLSEEQLLADADTTPTLH